MKFTLPHWILALVALVGTVAPQVGQAFPQLAPAMALVVQLVPVVLAALGFYSGSVFAPKPPAPPSPPSAKAVGFVVGALCLVLGCAQVQAVFPVLQTIEQTVANDLAAGKTEPQIVSDVCADLGGSASTDAVCADAAIIVNDVVAVLLSSGVLAEPAKSHAKAIQAAHQAAR